MPFVQSSPEAQATHPAPPLPQLITLVLARGTQLPLCGSRQPVHAAPPPPPVPPPAPPPKPLLQVKVLGLHVAELAAQSLQALPALPQVVLFALFGGTTQAPEESQQPGQF